MDLWICSPELRPLDYRSGLRTFIEIKNNYYKYERDFSEITQEIILQGCPKCVMFEEIILNKSLHFSSYPISWIIDGFDEPQCRKLEIKLFQYITSFRTTWGRTATLYSFQLP
jgi:hypothetical protein